MKTLIVLLAILAAPAWMQLSGQDTAKTPKSKVEIYYFHATMRCPTCLAVEEQTKKTLDENFSEEMKAGTVKLIVLNLEDKQNKALNEKFEIGWSSLILYVPESDKSVNLTEDAFANARSHPDDFRLTLENKIKELM